MREAIYSFEPTAGLFTAGNLRQAAQTFPVASNLRVLRIPLEFHCRGSTGLNPEGTPTRAGSSVASSITVTSDSSNPSEVVWSHPQEYAGRCERFPMASQH